MTELVLNKEQKKELNEIFKKLEIHELHHVFSLLSEHSIKYTKTNNAVLFLDSDVPPNILFKIYDYSLKRFEESLLYRCLSE